MLATTDLAPQTYSEAWAPGPASPPATVAIAIDATTLAMILGCIELSSSKRREARHKQPRNEQLPAHLERRERVIDLSDVHRHHSLAIR